MVLITVFQRIVLEFAPLINERPIKTAAIQSLYSALWKTICSFFLSVSQLPNFIYNDMEIEYLHEGNRWQEFQQTKRSGSCGTRVPEGCCARETSCEVIITVSSLETLRFMMRINTPSPWLTLLLFLGKNCVNQNCIKQVKWYQFIKNQVKFVLVKEFLFHSIKLGMEIFWKLGWNKLVLTKELVYL